MPPDSAPLRVAILNDYEIVTAGTAALLAGHPRIQVVELSSRLPVLSSVDIVLVDTFTLVSEGLRGLADLSRDARKASAKVVVFSWNTSEVAVRQALAQGASGYLSKASSRAVLIEGLLAVHDGRGARPLDPADSDLEHTGAWPGQVHGLTMREAEVVGFIAKGLTNIEIAAELYLGINTIKTYVRTAYRKIGVTRRSQAVLWAVDNGFGLHAGRTLATTGATDQGAPGSPALEPLAQTVVAVDEHGPFTSPDDLVSQLMDRAELVRAVVPQLVGLSLAPSRDGITFTLVATSAQVAALDAVQYLDGGPCVHAARAGEVVALDAEDLLDEDTWRQFSESTAASGVRSTLSLPILEGGAVTGTVNLYASTSKAFHGHHEEVAEVFGAWAPGAVTNADLSFASRHRAEQAPQLLRDDLDIQVAVAMVAARDGLDPDVARAMVLDAADRAGVDVAELARTIMSSGRG